MSAFKRLKRGFTLVELMIVVAIIGILAAMAVYGVKKYITNTKNAEATQATGRIAKDASKAASAESRATTGVLALSGTEAMSSQLCTTAANTVPTAGISAVKAMKYQSDPSEWGAKDTSARQGWRCLKFSMEDPQYYMYNYLGVPMSGTTAGSFTAVANGDLDGDGTQSTFALVGAQDVATGAVRIAPSHDVTAAEE